MPGTWHGICLLWSECAGADRAEYLKVNHETQTSDPDFWPVLIRGIQTEKI